MNREAIEAALMIRAGREKLAEKTYGPAVMESTRSIRARSLVDLCAASLQLDRRDVPSGRNEMIRAAFSTLSLPTALGNVMGKSLLEAYQESPSSWRSFAKVASAPNFKQQTGIRPSYFPNMQVVGKSGEVKHGTLTEATYPWSIGTYGNQFRVTREDVINDDLGFLSELPALMARSAMRTLSDLVWTKILANSGSFFATGHLNYQEGSGTALSLASLEDLVTLMLTTLENGGAGVVLRQSKMAAHMCANLEQGMMRISHGAQFPERPRSAMRHGDLERGAPGSTDGRVEQARSLPEVRLGLAYAAEDPGACGAARLSAAAAAAEAEAG